MRRIVLAFTICVTIASWCQQAPANRPTVSDLLSKLQSKDWTDRSQAVDEIRADPAALRSPKLRVALIDLLDRENREADKAFRNAKNASAQASTESTEDTEEGYGEYCAWLSQTVESFANWNDPRQACILVDAAQVTYPSLPKEAAARARAAMPCLLQRSQSDLKINREIAVPMLAEALIKGQGTLNPGTVQKARLIILSDLRDPDVGVRSSAVDALERFGGPEMIPALQDVARTDPASEPGPDGKGPVFVIRENAAKAITAIQQREGQQKLVR